jgi:hypothetical protein
VIHTDDTGWRVGGGSAFLMAFVNQSLSVYQVRPRHRHEEVLTTGAAGWLTLSSDKVTCASAPVAAPKTTSNWAETTMTGGISRKSSPDYFTVCRSSVTTLTSVRIGPSPDPEEPPSPEPPKRTPTIPTCKRKRGRPCKCAERGIICRHQTSVEPNSLTQQPSSPSTFS